MNAPSATDLIHAAQSHHYSLALALLVVLLVAMLRKVTPETVFTSWIKTDFGGALFAILAALAGGIGTALAASRAPWSPDVVLPALGVGLKAIALYVLQRKASGKVPAPAPPADPAPATPAP